MKTTRIVLFLMVLSILWCADVFAHWFDENRNAVAITLVSLQHIFVRAPRKILASGQAATQARTI